PRRRLPRGRPGQRRNRHRAQAAGPDPAVVLRRRRHRPARARMSTCVYSIGSNQGDRLALLQGAVDSLRPWLVAVSPVYQTPPWGPIAQDDYLNAVVVARDDAASAPTWLARAQLAEQQAGRTRDVRWGPR